MSTRMATRSSTDARKSTRLENKRLDNKRKFNCINDLCAGSGCVYKQPPIEFPSQGIQNPCRSLLDSKCLIQVQQLLEFGASINMLDKMDAELKKTKDPDRVCKALHGFLPHKCIPAGWKVNMFLGRGSFGNVFSTSGPSNARGALKIMVDHHDTQVNDTEVVESTDKKDAMSEKTISNQFHEYGLSPKTNWMCSHSLLDDSNNNKTLYVTHMSRIDGVLEDYLAKARGETELFNIAHNVMSLVTRLHSLGFTHGDFHIGNIGYVFLDGISATPHFQIIDHGFATTKASFPAVDIGQLLRTIVDREISPTMNENNRRLMNNYIRQHAWTFFRLSFAFDADDIHNKYIADRDVMFNA